MPCNPNSSSSCSSSIQQTPWQWPWIVMILSLYIFCLPWVASAIVSRYWIEKDYNAVLVGLDETAARQFFMVSHMSLGAVSLLCGPTQFLSVVRRKWPVFHRWSGRIYVLSAVLCSIFGLVFICLKGFILVGGLNMGLAFAVAGILFGSCAILTAVHARKRDFTKHRQWAIRSYGQMLAPMLYRYFYLILGGLQLYPETELDCNEKDICHPFTKAFDAIHAWTYFIFPLICTEFIIRALPNENVLVETPKKVETEEQDDTEQQRVEEVEEEEDKKETTESQQQDLAETTTTTTTTSSTTNFNYRRLNVLGIIGMVFCVGSTVLIYVTGLLGTNTVSA